MSLPTWIETELKLKKTFDVDRTRLEDRLMKALTIAVEALEDVKKENILLGGDKRVMFANAVEIINKALCRIEELGK